MLHEYMLSCAQEDPNRVIKLCLEACFEENLASKFYRSRPVG